MNSLFTYDENLREEYEIICGCDEAGRGPLCGPVCCAAVIFKPDFFNEEINDSKKLSEKKRNALYDVIIENSISYSVTFISPQEIDEINILNASLLGMSNAVKQLSLTPKLVLIDGNKTPKDLDIETRAIVKGDSNSASIAAASILAKVSRDRYMQTLSEKYPEYMLEKHKGYPTKLHYELLQQHGARSFYRKSFLKNRPEILWINA